MAEHRENERSSARATVVIAALTFVLAVAAVISAVLTYRTLGAIEGQLEEMHSSGGDTKTLADAAKAQANAASGQLAVMAGQLRPWIKVEAEPKGPLRMLPRNVAIIPAQFRLINVGHSPAFDIRIVTFSSPMFSGGGELDAEPRDRCDKALPQSQIIKQILFPGEAYVAELLGGRPLTSFSWKDGTDSFGIWFYACIEYTLTRDDRHRTTVMYTVAKITNNGQNLDYSFLPGVTIPAEQLTFEPWPSPAGQTN